MFLLSVLFRVFWCNFGVFLSFFIIFIIFSKTSNWVWVRKFPKFFRSQSRNVLQRQVTTLIIVLRNIILVYSITITTFSFRFFFSGEFDPCARKNFRMSIYLLVSFGLLILIFSVFVTDSGYFAITKSSPSIEPRISGGFG